MTTTHDVPMPFSPYLVSEWTGPEMIDRKTWTAYTAGQVRDTAIAYADARCARLQAELDQCRQLEQSAMDGLAFAYKFNVAMGNGMRAAGCTIVDFDIKNDRAEKAESERDALAEKVKAMEADARRYRWLRKFSANSVPDYVAVPTLVWAGRYDDRWLFKLDDAIDAAGGDQC